MNGTRKNLCALRGGGEGVAVCSWRVGRGGRGGAFSAVRYNKHEREVIINASIEEPLFLSSTGYQPQIDYKWPSGSFLKFGIRTCSYDILRGPLRGSLGVCHSGLVLFLPLVVNLEPAMKFLSASFQKLNIWGKKSANEVKSRDLKELFY